MRSKGILFTIVSAILFGLAPALAKWIYADGINSSTLIFFRNLFAVLPLFLLCHRERCDFHLSLHQGAQLLLAAIIGQCISALLLYSSYRYIPIATATTLHFFYPMFISIICVILFHERITMFKVLALLAATLGVACFVDGVESTSKQGFSLALASALTFAYYLVAVEKSGLNRLHPFVITFYFSLIVALSLGFYNLCFHQFTLPSDAFIYGKLVVFSFFTFVLPMRLLQLGIGYLGAADAAIFCMFEPVSAFFSGIVFLREEITLLNLAGCVLILGSVTFLIFMNQRVAKRKEG